MKNTVSRENERDDKFLGAAGSMGHRGWIQKEDWDSQDSSPRSTKLRRTIYRFIASPTVIVFPWNEIGWKIPRRSERWKKKKYTGKRKPSFAGVSLGQERLLLQRDVIYFILVVWRNDTLFTHADEKVFVLSWFLFLESYWISRSDARVHDLIDSTHEIPLENFITSLGFDLISLSRFSKSSYQNFRDMCFRMICWRNLFKK